MTTCIEPLDLEARIRKALAQPGGDNLSAFAVIRKRSVTRFANSSIHQAFDESSVRVEFRAHAVRGVTLTSSTDSIDRKSLARAARNVIEIAPASAAQICANAPTTDDAGAASATTASTQAERVHALAEAFRVAPAGVSFAGVFGASTLSLLHVRADRPGSHARTTKATANVYAIGEKGDEGYDGAAHRDISVLDITAVARAAATRAARASRPKRRADPGPIEALLAPDAVEDLLSGAAPIAFGGKMFAEGAGFSAGRLGESMFDAKLTIHDDGSSDDPLSLRMPFDCDGVPKRCTTLVDRGRIVGIAHDTTTADLAGTESTGHAAHEDVEAGPLPLHLQIEPGDASVDELIAGVESGLWITRFHYVNAFVNPHEGAMTGLTRGGTFLIEHGRITDPIETARFSDRFSAIFSSIARIGAERRLVPSWQHDAAGAVVPAIHVRAIHLA